MSCKEEHLSRTEGQKDQRSQDVIISLHWTYGGKAVKRQAYRRGIQRGYPQHSPSVMRGQHKIFHCLITPCMEQLQYFIKMLTLSIYSFLLYTAYCVAHKQKTWMLESSC